MDEIELALQFYAEGEHYGWEGCSCHGHYTIEDHGDMAEEGLTRLEELRKMIGESNEGS